MVIKMDIIKLSQHKDIFYKILDKMGESIIVFRNVSKYFKKYVYEYVDKNKKLTYNIDVNKYKLHSELDTDEIIINRAKIEVFINHKTQMDNKILTFLFNNYILVGFEKYHIWVKSKMYLIISERDNIFLNTKRIKKREDIIGFKMVLMDRVKNINNNIIKLNKHINKNYNMLLIKNHNNFGILKLTSMIKNIMVLQLLNEKNKNTLLKFNNLYKFYDGNFNIRKAKIDEIKHALTAEQYEALIKIKIEI